jgi:hypothetical protein
MRAKPSCQAVRIAWRMGASRRAGLVFGGRRARPQRGHRFHDAREQVGAVLALLDLMLSP